MGFNGILWDINGILWDFMGFNGIFMVEGSLEVKLPTIWTVEKQR